MIKLIDLNIDNSIDDTLSVAQIIGTPNQTISNDSGLPIQTNNYIFTIRSNEKSFTTLINGTTQSTNGTIRISKESLINSSAKIEIQKDGYISDEYYLVEIIDDGGTVIKNPILTNQIPLGLSTKRVVVKRFVRGEQIGSNISMDSKTSETLNFQLVKRTINLDTPLPIPYNIDFIISGMGSSVSILKNNNKNAEFFPPNGSSRYQDINDTQYTIRSSDLSLYRITSILWSDTNNSFQKEYKSNNGESVEVDVRLKDNYVFKIQTEEVNVGTPALNPKIELVKGGARTYNINSKVGVPLMFKKNKDVKAITIIVGDDIIEFDDLDKGDLCGITIPYDVFEKIGKYNVKIFPFSFDEYEQQVRPAVTGNVIEPKKVELKYNTKEEVKSDLTNVTNKYNSYSPLPTNGRIDNGPNTVTIDSVRNIRGL